MKLMNECVMSNSSSRSTSLTLTEIIRIFSYLVLANHQQRSSTLRLITLSNSVAKL